MLKKQRQIFYIRLQRMEPLVVFRSVRVFGHSDKLPSGLTLLTPQPVKIHNDDDQDPCDDTLPESIDIQQVSSVVNGRQDKGSKQRPVNRSDRAKEAGATDDRRGYRLQLPPLSLRRVTDADTHGKQYSDECSTYTGKRIGDIDHANRIHARKTSRFRVGSNCKEITAKPALVQEDVTGNGDHYHHPEKIGYPEKIAAREAGKRVICDRYSGAIRD